MTAHELRERYFRYRTPSSVGHRLLMIGRLRNNSALIRREFARPDGRKRLCKALECTMRTLLEHAREMGLDERKR
jgi:hypothetical protein